MSVSINWGGFTGLRRGSIVADGTTIVNFVDSYSGTLDISKYNSISISGSCDADNRWYTASVTLSPKNIKCEPLNLTLGATGQNITITKNESDNEESVYSSLKLSVSTTGATGEKSATLKGDNASLMSIGDSFSGAFKINISDYKNVSLSGSANYTNRGYNATMVIN